MAKKLIVWLLIVSHVMLITPVLSAGATPKKMRVVKVQKDLLAGNKGSNEGIRPNEIYQIIRVSSNKSYKIIGQAQVVRSTTDLSALKIIEMQSGYIPQNGDYLLEQKMFASPEARDEGVDLLPSSSQSAGLRFSTGENAAEQMYSGKAAFWGGVGTGTAFGLIGWLVGSAVVNSQSVEVPNEYLYQLNQNDQLEFRMGYTQYVKEKRSKMFNDGSTIGVMLGTIITVAIIANKNSK